ncbi:MAG TPA: hypothetical protein VLT86_13655 [Vicinamibacterales bacterium]|nr:hypothetical protein [Vicinamibacterales bacterium]
MDTIRSGAVTALYLFDVAQAIDLAVVKRQLGSRAAIAKLDDKSAGPPRVRYIQPPVVADGEALGCRELDGFQVRVKFYDYGVISLMLSRPFAGSWADLVGLGQALIENEPLEQHAADACQRIAATVGPALTGRRSAFLDEDYLIFAVTSLEEPQTSAAMLERHGGEIAQLLRGERQPLSQQERDSVLRNALSYVSDDLVVPAWNAAFICDAEPAVLQAVEILEFANSQLLEFRYYDDLLESELTRIYAELQQFRWVDRFARRRYARAARELQALFIDVNELTDRLENAVKFVGDIYAARLFGNIAARLGLDRWKTNVEEKLRTLSDIRRFAVDQAGLSQANLLELAIVLILIIELGLFFAGIMK